MVSFNKLFLFLIKWSLVILGLFTMAALGAFLSMKVSILGTEVEVPEIINLTTEEAYNILSEQGLFLKIIGQRIDEEVSRGRILSQEPIAGSKIRKGRKIKVILSLGPEVLSVPFVIGDSERRARVKINQKGLNIRWLSYVHRDIEKRRVIAQSPSAGTKKWKGGGINLLISQGPKKKVYIMPDLIGKDGPSMIPDLESYGLRVGLLKKKRGPFDQEGTIISQYPLPGYPISEGEVVHMTAIE